MARYEDFYPISQEAQDRERLRVLFDEIRFIETHRRDMFEPARVGYMADRLLNLKKKARQIARREYWPRALECDADGGTVLERLPGCTTEAEAVEFFERHVYREYVPSQYDCTGQIFTNSFKVFNRGGEWYAYHSVCRDV